MPGPWKEWKTKPRFSTLPTAPWKSRQPREISTFPQLRRAAPGKVENQNQVSTFPHATREDDDDSILKNQDRLRAACGGPRTNQKRRASHRQVSSPRSRMSGSPRIRSEIRFQAHSALEINIDFRLTFGLENARC